MSSITPELLEYYTRLHKETDYGTTGARNAGPEIVRTLGSRSIETILDYGAGSGSLGAYTLGRLPAVWTEYDPAIDGKDVLPEGPFDAVVSTDVLEHIEPHLTDAALEEIFSRAKKTVCLYIACSPTGKLIEDGRDQHVNVQTPSYWLDKVSPLGVVMEARDISQRKRGQLKRSVYLVLDV